MRERRMYLHGHTLCCSCSKGFMKFVDDLLEAIRRDILAMGAEEVQLNVPFTQWHLHIRIATAITIHIG